MATNCNISDVLREEDKSGEILYGKKILKSHESYNLWDESNDFFNLGKIERFYQMFLYNMLVLRKHFSTKWIPNDMLLTTTKGLIWDWTSEEERKMTAESIDKFGMYFPIFVLPQGELHNQICSQEEMKKLREKNLYNSYNGNHRIDAIFYLVEQGLWDSKEEVLVYIIPSYCQKSCTGFKYTPIDDCEEGSMTRWKLSEPVELIHFNKVEHEMKVTNWRQKREIEDGVSMVLVDNYNVAFRLMLEAQNILEPVLTRYYELYGTLPDTILEEMAIFNERNIWDNVPSVVEEWR